MKTTRIRLERPDDSECSTYFAVAREIAKIDSNPGEAAWLEAVEAIVKKFGHHEKLSAYTMALDHVVNDTFDRTKEYLESKVETHKDFSSRPLDMQIYGRGEWTK